MELGAVAVLVTLLSCPWSLASMKRSLNTLFTLPLLFLHLFFLWTLTSAIGTASHAFATQGILPLAAGVLIVDVTVIQTRAIDRCLFIVDALLGAGLIFAFSGLVLYGNSGMPNAVGVFYDHQLFGAFSMLIIPISLCVTLAPVIPIRKIVAQVTSVACLAALLATRCRSAWIAEVFALATFGFLLVFAEAQIVKPLTTSLQRRRVFLYGIGVVTAIIGFVLLFVGLSPDRAATLARAQTATTILRDKDASTQWRLAVWTGTKTMIAEKAVTGWGTGSYPLFHYPFTKTGHPTDVVQREGPSIEDEAHNSYLQIAAELGVIGLGLWLITFSALIVCGILMVRHLATDRIRQLLLIGSLSAIVGQMVDALANPGWQFGCIMLYLWIIFGLVGSSFRLSSVSFPRISYEITEAISWPKRVIFIAASLGVGYALVRLILQTAFALPAPHL